jgi:hypothetical protein
MEHDHRRAGKHPARQNHRSTTFIDQPAVNGQSINTRRWASGPPINQSNLTEGARRDEAQQHQSGNPSSKQHGDNLQGQTGEKYRRSGYNLPEHITLCQKPSATVKWARPNTRSNKHYGFL